MNVHSPGRWLMNPQFKIYIYIYTLSDLFSTFGMLFRSQSSNQRFFWWKCQGVNELRCDQFFWQKILSFSSGKPTFEIPSAFFSEWHMANASSLLHNVSWSTMAVFFAFVMFSWHFGNRQVIFAGWLFCDVVSEGPNLPDMSTKHLH